MTTIAWDGETLAADSQVTDDNFVWQHADKKIFKIRDFYLATAGDADQCMKFLDWFKNRDISKFPDGMDDVTVLVVGPKVCDLYGNGAIPTPIKPPFAIGSGSACAMGAMLAGAKARRAVQIASKLCKYTGGPVRTVKIKR